MKKTFNLIPIITGLIFCCAIAPFYFFIGPIPMTLQSLAILMVAAIFGKRTGLIVALLYLLLGAIGLPIFAGFQSGFDRFISRTAGFLWAYPLAAYYLGWQCEHGEKTWIHTIIYFFRAQLLIIIIGVIGAYLVLQNESLLWDGIVKLLPGLLLKTIVGGLLAYYLQKIIPPQWTELSSQEKK